MIICVEPNVVKDEPCVLRGRTVGRSVVLRVVWCGLEEGRVLDDVNFDIYPCIYLLFVCMFNCMYA